MWKREKKAFFLILRNQDSPNWIAFFLGEERKPCSLMQIMYLASPVTRPGSCISKTIDPAVGS